MFIVRDATAAHPVRGDMVLRRRHIALRWSAALSGSRFYEHSTPLEWGVVWLAVL